MPGPMNSSDPSAVMPFSLCQAFRRTRTFASVQNIYKGGEYQSALLSKATSPQPRASWACTKRLRPTEMQALWTFFASVNGEQKAFWFYDVWETTPMFAHDPTGAAEEGRYAARFAAGWWQTNGLCRGDVELAIVEVF